MDTSEKRFEHDIESFLIGPDGGFEQFSYQNPDGAWIQKYAYDKEKLLYPEVLVNFVMQTQPKEWAKYVKYYGSNATEKLCRRLQDSIATDGLVSVLRNGILDMGIRIRVCFFKPESDLNQTAEEHYAANILGVTRQFSYSLKNHNTIDMVLSVNGIPVAALELKNQFKGQDVSNAIFFF